MTRARISRRSALGMIGRTGVALGAGTCFFLSLKTSPLTAASREQESGGASGYSVPEKVVISGQGPAITARISGPPGRYYAVVYATEDAREAFQTLAGARGRLSEKGQGTVTIDAKLLPEGRIFLRVATARSPSFDEGVAGTEAFVVKVSKGSVTGYEGVLTRPLLSARSNASAATCASAGVRVKPR